MREGVCPCLSGLIRGQGHGQFRIQEGEVRVHETAVDPPLFFLCAHGENSGKGHLASRARSSGNHDGGQAGPRDRFESDIVLSPSVVYGQHSNRLGHIKTASTAHADYKVTAFFFGQFCSLIGEDRLRFRRYLVVSDISNAAC